MWCWYNKQLRWHRRASSSSSGLWRHFWLRPWFLTIRSDTASHKPVSDLDPGPNPLGIRLVIISDRATLKSNTKSILNTVYCITYPPPTSRSLTTAWTPMPLSRAKFTNSWLPTECGRRPSIGSSATAAVDYSWVKRWYAGVWVNDVRHQPGPGRLYNGRSTGNRGRAVVWKWIVVNIWLVVYTELLKKYIGGRLLRTSRAWIQELIPRCAEAAHTWSRVSSYIFIQRNLARILQYNTIRELDNGCLDKHTVLLGLLLIVEWQWTI